MRASLGSSSSLGFWGAAELPVLPPSRRELLSGWAGRLFRSP